MTDAATPETATAPEIHDLASAARAIEKIIRRETPPATDGDEPAQKVRPDDVQDDDAGAETEEEVEHDPGVDDDDESDGDTEEARFRV
jgi:hypothetical protein